MTIILSLFLLIALLGWLKNKLGLLTLVYFMRTKNYTPPSEEETAACSTWVIKSAIQRKKKQE